MARARRAIRRLIQRWRCWLSRRSRLHRASRRALAIGGVSQDGPQAGPAAWGMSGALFVALILQLAFFGAIVGAVYVGLYAHDPGVAHAAWRDGIGEKIDHAGGAIAQTPTIALAALLLYALVAPLTEEFAKLLGVLLALRRRSVSRYTAFIAGVSAGLGFAVVETLLYGLAANDKWPILIGLRAPVAFIHVTGTALTALGWHMQRTRGGLALVWHYIAAVLVHAAWNGLTVALLIASATTHDGEHVSVATGLTLLTVLSLMALLLLCCLTWVVLNARRFGKADVAAERQREARASTPSQRVDSNAVALCRAPSPARYSDVAQSVGYPRRLDDSSAGGGGRLRVDLVHPAGRLGRRAAHH